MSLRRYLRDTKHLFGRSLARDQFDLCVSIIFISLPLVPLHSLTHYRALDVIISWYIGICQIKMSDISRTSLELRGSVSCQCHLQYTRAQSHACVCILYFFISSSSWPCHVKYRYRYRIGKAKYQCRWYQQQKWCG